MKNIYLIILTILYCNSLFSQDCKGGLLLDSNGRLNFDTRLYSGVFLQSNCDTVKIFKETIFDSSFYHRLHKYVTISNQGKLISEGNKASKSGYCGGCGPFKNGFWNEYHRNGKLKSTGKYICESKIGEWRYYADDGSIEKVENYAEVDWETNEKLIDPLDTFVFKGTGLHGPYIEYFKNGSVKISGMYRIEYVKDSVQKNYSIDESITYPISKEVNTVPKIRKTGIWRYYDLNGTLSKEENY